MSWLNCAAVPAILAGLSISFAQAQQGPGQLDVNETLFTTLAAINAAGYNVDVDSPLNSPVRKMIRDAIAAENPPSLQDLKKFFNEHQQHTDKLELSQYVSFALCIGPAPLFEYRYNQEDLPPDVKPLDGLAPLLTRFYREADIPALWRKAQPAFEEALRQYHPGVTRAVQQVNAYLRNIDTARGGHFQIYLSLLGPPNQVHTRSYLRDYFVVITPADRLQVDEIRHAYIHYLLDPMAFRYAAAVDMKRGLSDYAQGAPALEDIYKNDFLLLMSECLIKAVEARLAPPDQRKGMVEQDLREGFVVTPALFELLPVYEKQDQSMRYYYPDLIEAIDLRREAKRLNDVSFVQERATRTFKVEVPVRPPELAGAAKTLDGAERLYTSRNLDKAREEYLKVLQESAPPPLHAKAYYGLARIAALQRNPELAQRLFEKTLNLSPDSDTRSWSLLYLGRLADAEGDRQQAEERYKAALAVPGVPANVKSAAEKGLKESFHRNPNP